MKLKLDENLGLRGLELLSTAGHDVCTVPAQDLCSATDDEIAARCCEDGRGIVTLDMALRRPRLDLPRMDNRMVECIIFLPNFPA